MLLPGLLGPKVLQAQIDPVKRELIQFGYNQPLEGRAPLAAYAFYYYNQPEFLRTNLTLRLVVAPIYLDSELDFKSLLGPNTDFGLGVAGGGFADSYYEVRQGEYLPSESFDGHGAVLSGNVYHLFNPTQLIPLNAVVRGEAHYTDYERTSDTDPNFAIPKDVTSLNVRAGLRLGGMEPVINPDVALELSVWYEGQFRENSSYYGFPVNGVIGDRSVEDTSQLYWGRALFAYTLPKWKHNFLVSLTAGGSVKADRLSAYRLGGFLPLASEFPLVLPGYYYQEISARRFALLNGTYSLPLDRKKRWALTAVASGAVVNYLPGLEQPGSWHSGVGGGLAYRSTNGAWQVMLDYGYGFQALRDHGPGAQSIGVLIQFNLVRTQSNYYDPGANSFIRVMDRFLHSFD